MPANTKEKIITVTQQLIITKQSIDVRLNDIADAVGITHGALYRHFKDKRALMTAVATRWFQEQIISQIPAPGADQLTTQVLHDWLWHFVNAKKAAYNQSPTMFALNTTYIENDPVILRTILTPTMQQLDQLLGFHDPDCHRAEAILSAFSVFALPSFRETWNRPDYQARFETLWTLIEQGLTGLAANV